MNLLDKLRFKLLMMKRVKAFTLSLQKGLSITEARKITDEEYPVSEEYLEYEKGLKVKEK
jgi:hypothetical protein